MAILDRKSTFDGVFVPTTMRRLNASEWELKDDPRAQKIIARYISLVYDFDWSQVHVAGWVDDPRGGGIRISVAQSADGAIIEGVGVDRSVCEVRAQIFARDGYDIRAAKRRRFIEEFTSAWLRANGFEPDYPASVEVVVTDNAISVEVVPVH